MQTGTDMGKKVEIVRGLEHEISVLLRRIRRVVGERARLVHPDLSPVAYSMMAAIAERGPSRASELVDTFDIDKGAVSRHMAQLIDLGLVQRHPDPKDGRALLLSLTDDGRSRFEAVTEKRRLDMAEQFADWSAGDFEDFLTSLRNYNDTLGRPS